VIVAPALGTGIVRRSRRVAELYGFYEPGVKEASRHDRERQPGAER